jgi:hypothetical protein
MTGEERFDVFGLFRKALARDEARLNAALALAVDRPDYGFVWLATDDAEAVVGAAFVSYGISSAAGGLVARIDDLAIDPEIINADEVRLKLILELGKFTTALEIAALETSVAIGDGPAQAFVQRCGFKASHDERYLLVL